MSYNKIELGNKEIFGPRLIVVEENGVFQFQIEGQRKYIQINRDAVYTLRRFITSCLTDTTASQVQSFGSTFDKCRGKS